MLFEGILVILLCLVLSAFFSGMETGVISINRLRLRHRVRDGQRSARILEAFLRDSDHLLGTTLIGNNLCLVVLSILTASLSLRYGGEAARIIAGTAMSLTVLTFCEYLPKSWFHAKPLDRCQRFALPLRFFWRLFRPFIWMLTQATRWTNSHQSGGPLQGGTFVTREHLQLMARDSERWGHLTVLERAMIDRVLRLQNQTAGRIMTPLARVVCVERTDTLGRFYEKIRQSGFLRMPVRDSETAAFVGILNLFYVTGQPVDPDQTQVDAFMRPPLFLPASMRGDDILPVLRHHRQPMALVRNAEEQVVGLVTTEDVLQQITGIAG